MPFAIPMIWTESKRLLFLFDSNKRRYNQVQTQYPNLSSTNRPILHSAELPMRKLPNRSESQDSTPKLVLNQHDRVSEDSDPSYEPSTSKEPHLLTQSDLRVLFNNLLICMISDFENLT
ncbi:unnamed protein product [Psylliodes chrysocephalus]|uniref:Uncharacterized protein n=1 Tax=Psylliodes chrysocephalus TaxID=3402493 RepID=A0A9P0GET1_9CUCU|nr:unnamed protein product [Psylliodes chrysocephala]